MPKLNAIMGSPILSKIGSTENGTVRETKMLAAIGNRLYLCSVKHLPVSSSSQTWKNGGSVWKNGGPVWKNGASKLSKGASVQMNGASIRKNDVEPHKN